MRYDIVLMDIDNTLLDFNAGTKESLTALLQHHGLQLTPERLARFFALNDDLWRRYERGEIEKEHIFSTRFACFLGEMGVETDALQANAMYADGLKQSAVLMPHALWLMEQLSGRARLFAVTNGVTTTQIPRLEKSGLRNCFEQVFISEQMGCKKPEKEFFEKVFAAIGPVERSRCIILGDSLSSDMQGGRNAGIATCFLGQDAKDPRCDYVIEDLRGFPAVLGL